ncbi:MAG: FtsX-like permease family protein [Candidatus Aenigmarchaeota archaeon]|nr:FtsX-like permease family protein [Candidatus Aenigmarchaeota archaeon]
MSAFRTVSFLAMKDLKRDKKIAALVICLLAFSYLNITFFSAFINGLGNTFQDSIINTATSHIFITPSENTNPKYIDDVSALRKKIDLNPDVVGSTVHINVPITITFRNRQMSAQGIGVKASDEATVLDTPTQYVESGSFLSDNSNNEIVLGRYLAGQKLEDTIGKDQFGALLRGLGADVGQVVTVTYPNGVRRDYKVRGIVGSNGFNAVSQAAFITINEADDVLGIQDKASAVLVKLDDRNKADEVKNFILEQGVKNVEVKTWMEASSFVSAITSTFSIVIFVLSFVGIVIVVVTIGIVIFINTTRKKRIIGVLKAIGMSDNQIMMIFITQSVILSIAGVLFGVLLFSGINFFFSQNPIVLPIGSMRTSLGIDSVISTALLIVISALVAGYVPARMASRQKIIDTIKTVE